MKFLHNALAYFNLILYGILAIPIIYYGGGFALSLVGHIVFLVLWTFGDIFHFIFNGPSTTEWHITSKEWMGEFFTTLGGDFMYAVTKIWELITSNYSLLLGLAVMGFLIRTGLSKVLSKRYELAMQKNNTPPVEKKQKDIEPKQEKNELPRKNQKNEIVPAISAAFFESADLKHDANGEPYVAIGIFMDVSNKNAFYMAFYNHDRELKFVNVRDEQPYQLTYHDAISKNEFRKIVVNASKFRLKAQQTLNSYPLN